MNCNNCGTFLADGVNICPKCGTPTFNYPQPSPSYDPTVPASYDGQQQPSTNYGPGQYAFPAQSPQYSNSGPYGAPSQLPSPPSQYSNSGPYGAPPQLPYNNMPPFQSSPNKARKGPGIAVVVGLVLLLIVLIGGGLAFFLTHKSSSNGQVTQKATSTSTPAPTPTPNPAKNPYSPGTGALVVNDPMQDNSKGYEWNESSTPLTGGGAEICQFNNKTYHTIRTQRGSLVCPAEASTLSLSNIAYEANLTVTTGDYSGLAFRVNLLQETGYVFAVGVSGDYVIDTFNFKAPVNSEFTILRKGTSTAVKRGWNQTNLIAIVANGANISLYINNQLVNQIQDNTYTQGQIGTYGYGQTTSDITAKDVRVWSL